jgi:hypothetical protein
MVQYTSNDKQVIASKNRIATSDYINIESCDFCKAAFPLRTTSLLSDFVILWDEVFHREINRGLKSILYYSRHSPIYILAQFMKMDSVRQ